MQRLLLISAITALAFSSEASARGGGGHGGHVAGVHAARATSSSATGDHFVSGYTRSNGTYVQGHFQTNPNGTRNDNYSTRGNVNPYTGQAGTKPRDGEAPN